jgi:hypothetical protein
MHAQAYKNIGFELTVCMDINQDYGRKLLNSGEPVRLTYEEAAATPRWTTWTYARSRFPPAAHRDRAQTGKHVRGE